MLARNLALVSLLLCAAPCVLAQQKPPDPPVVPVPHPQASADLHRQMLDLIGQVELRLRAIDKLLAQAGSAQRPAAQGGTRCADLVRRSQAEGQQVIEAIDKILELANTPHHPSGSGSGA